MAGRHCNARNNRNQFLTRSTIPVPPLLLYKPVFPLLLICGCTALSSPFKDLYLKDCLSAYILDLLPTELFILFFRDVYRHLYCATGLQLDVAFSSDLSYPAGPVHNPAVYNQPELNGTSAAMLLYLTNMRE